jgi:hypothetical protein
MAGIYLGTFARSLSCAEDMKDFKCQRQSEMAYIANLLGISNRWVWMRLYNMPELNFTRPSTPVVRSTWADSILVVAGFRLRFAGVSARICSSKLAPSSTRMFSCAGGRKAPTGGDL